MSDVEKIVLVLGFLGVVVGGDEDFYKFKSVKFWVMILCNFFVFFLVVLDCIIIVMVVLRIMDEFNFLGDIGWYGFLYMLMMVCV